MVNHHTALELMRLETLQKRAQAHRDSARRSGNIARMSRAARLETAACAKETRLVMGEIETYHNSD